MYCLLIPRKDGKGFYKSSKSYPIFGCRCENCKKWKKEENLKWRKNKPASYNKKYNKKHYNHNRYEILKNAKNNYKTNKLLIRKYQKEYFKTEEGREAIRRGARKRRARKRNCLTASYTEKQIVELYGTVCYICGLEIDFSAPRQTGRLGWQKGLHIEHVIDIALGGPDTIENVRPSHAICNLTKSRSRK